MNLSLICLVSSIIFLVCVIGMIWNILMIGRQLSETPPFPVTKTMDDMWGIMTSKFGIHVAFSIGMFVSGIAAALSFAVMATKG